MKLKLESLEDRSCPATLDVSGGVLTYADSADDVNDVTLFVDGADYVVADSVPIMLGSGAISAGWSGGGTAEVRGPTAGVSSLDFGLGGGDDGFASYLPASWPVPASVSGGIGDDTMRGNGQNLTWHVTGADSGSAGHVSFDLGTGTNHLTGSGGNDNFTFSGGTLSGTVTGGAGSDTLTLTSGSASTFTISGSNTGSTTGAYTITSFVAVENLTGGTGSDVFSFGSTSALLSGKINGGGGSGADWLDYTGRGSSAVTVNLSANSATAVSAGLVGATGILNVRATSGNDVITGSGGNNIIVGGAGADRLNGVDGRDILFGGAGADVLNGGSGDNIVLGGTTTHDNDNAALAAIMAIWDDATPLATRTGAIATDGTYPLDEADIGNDSASDRLTGGADADWFLWSATDVLVDLTGSDQSDQILI